MNKKLQKFVLILFLAILTINLSGCHPAPPNNVQNICSIFRQYHTWYWDAQKTQKNWGIPISVLMAIIYQESRFNATAKPPRKKLLWIIPWKRPTSAYGYSQAVNSTWRLYKRDTRKNGAKRSAFGDAANFIGWFANRAHYQLGISMHNAYALYLAYHEGLIGYRQRTYLRKRWLMDVARRVQYRANIYRTQLIRCRSKLPKKPWWRFW